MTRLRRNRVVVSKGRRRASNVLLAVGYPTAVLAGAKLVPMFTERQTGRFLVFQAGTAAVVAGLALRRRRIPVLLNAGALAATSTAWWALGRGGRPGSPR
jgi:hypothetical protein